MVGIITDWLRCSGGLKSRHSHFLSYNARRRTAMQPFELMAVTRKNVIVVLRRWLYRS